MYVGQMTHTHTYCVFVLCGAGCCALWPGDEHGGRLTGQSFPLTFDFGLGGLDGGGDTLAPDSMSRMGKKG